MATGTGQDRLDGSLTNRHADGVHLRFEGSNSTRLCPHGRYARSPPTSRPDRPRSGLHSGRCSLMFTIPSAESRAYRTPPPGLGDARRGRRSRQAGWPGPGMKKHDSVSSGEIPGSGGVLLGPGPYDQMNQYDFGGIWAKPGLRCRWWQVRLRGARAGGRVGQRRHPDDVAIGTIDVELSAAPSRGTDFRRSAGREVGGQHIDVARSAAGSPAAPGRHRFRTRPRVRGRRLCSSACRWMGYLPELI